MAHNFYLYDDPTTGQLTWISWDHNMTMSTGGSMGEGMGRPDAATPDDADAVAPDAPRVIRGPGRGGMNRSVSLDRAEVTEEWPLIRYLLGQPAYYAQYLGYMQATTDELFVPERMEAEITQMAALIEPYASDDVGAETFANAVQQLIDYVQTRHAAVTSFLSEQ